MTNSNHDEVIGEFSEDTQRWAMQALDAALSIAINYVRGDDESMLQPGVKIRTSKSGNAYYYYSPSLPVRQAHPGGWADVTGLTSNMYGTEDAIVQGGFIRGSIFNTAEHAEDLEGKLRIGRGGIHRYWVIEGLTEAVDNDFSIGQVFEDQFNRIVDDKGS